MLAPLSKYLIQQSSLIKEALHRLNSLDKLILFVLDDNQVLKGTLTDGDIRRGLMRGLNMDVTVADFMNTKYRAYTVKALTATLVAELRKDNITVVPVLDGEGRIERLIDFTKTRAILPISAVIMAGGRGERLKPLTDSCPKPMLNIGDKPILEHVIDRLIDYGVINIYISVKYLAEQIIEYFGDGSNKGIKIQYIHEDTPLGTFGAVSLLNLNECEHEHLLVMNSDLLTNIDFEDLYLHCLNEDADFTVASVPYKVNIPYAILEAENGIIKRLSEKPSYTYYANAGIYMFKASLIEQLEKNAFMNATDFCDSMLSDSRKVTVYPILGYWLDIGRHEDFQKANEDIKHIKV
ncbi:MAG: nucleotidyltransferase family protein [Chitinophagales bacterium]|nr:nucleotidyltransferase family protein [Chitinophagales bacterium]